MDVGFRNRPYIRNEKINKLKRTITDYFQTFLKTGHIINITLSLGIKYNLKL